MALYSSLAQAALAELKWDQFGYRVQPSDLNQVIWNLANYIDWLHGDVYGSSNGVVTGCNVSAGSGMNFNVTTGRVVAVGGTKVIPLLGGGPGSSTAPNGQPATLSVTLTNGTGMSVGQTRIDLICAQFQETSYQNSNAADAIVEGLGLVVVQGTPGAPGVAPSPPDNTYVALAAVTVHQGDTTSSQGTIDSTAAGLRTNFPSLLSLLSTINALGAVTLQGANPVAQSGNASINGFMHLGQFVEQAYIVTPSAPVANTVRVYYKSDGNRYIYDPVYGEQLDIPVGQPTPWISGTLPAGCFWIDGSVFNSTTYARLAGITAGHFKTGGETSNQDRLPDLRGRSFFGPDNFGSTGAANRIPGAVVGSTGGASTHVQTLGELVAHNHTDNGHSHGVTDGGHSHGITDPGHVHTNSVYITGSNGNFFGTGTSSVGGTATTGNATTNITINGANSNISLQTGNAQITNNGSSNAINIMNPYICGSGWIIRY